MAALTGDYDLVLESAGGESLTRALDLVGRGGLVVSFGNSARVPANLPVGSDASPGVLRALAERRIAGKAVLRMRGTAGTPR